MLGISLIIKLFSETPILFKQKRVGLNEEQFYLYKFCTMKKEEDINNSHLTIQDNPRITR